MGNATKLKHDLPSGIRTLKRSTLVSNSERLRSRSYSHEHELYRAGLGKNAVGEWKVVRRGVPPGLVDAMRKMALRSKSRSISRRARKSRSRSEARSQMMSVVPLKMEQMIEEDAHIVDTKHGADTSSDTNDEDIDMTDASAVLEEIRVYIDVDSVKDGIAVVTEEGKEIERLMNSIETMLDNKLDVKVEARSNVQDNHLSDGLDVPRESLDSIPEVNEADEPQMDPDSPQQAEEEPGRPRQATATVEGPQARRRRRKWTETETYHVGAWLDAGYAYKAIIDEFERTFPDAEGITTRMIASRRFMGLTTKEYKESISLGRKLGLENGQWENMGRKMRAELAWDEVQKRAVDIKARHQEEWSVANKELRSSSHDSGLGSRLCRRMCEMFINQRTEWRYLLKRPMESSNDFCPAWFRLGQGDEEVHLSHLSELVQHAKERESSRMFTPFIFSTENQERLNKRLFRETEYWKDWKNSLSSELNPLYEYGMARLMLQERQMSDTEDEIAMKVLDLLSFDERNLRIFIWNAVNFYGAEAFNAARVRFGLTPEQLATPTPTRSPTRRGLTVAALWP